MKILFAQSGLHRVQRGGEVALMNLAEELARAGDEVTVAGQGYAIPDRSYTFVHVPVISRRRFERWPELPFLRSPYMAEDAAFTPGVLWKTRKMQFDVTVSIDVPYTNRALAHIAKRCGAANVFITQNGDWPAQGIGHESRFFRCDGLVCTNPVYLDRNRERWNCALVPNGVDVKRFAPGDGDRLALGLPEGMPIVLMVSALMDTKRVVEGIRSVAKVPDVLLVVAGDGELRREADEAGAALLGDRYRRITLPFEQMPNLYRCADVFLHMSMFESFGNVYVEALATGLPVVAHDSEVTRWILGDHGELVDTTDEDATADAIKRSFGRGGESERVAAAALFSWQSAARQFREFAVQVVDRVNRP